VRCVEYQLKLLNKELVSVIWEVSCVAVHTHLNVVTMGNRADTTGQASNTRYHVKQLFDLHSLEDPWNFRAWDCT
jgi:hypothetical protein